MDYLFFDCEFSNCFNGISKICEIGYVITDTNFKVLSSKDILIDPGKGGRFYLSNRIDNREDCFLSHPYPAYYSSPRYDHYYPFLKNLFSKKDRIYFGFAVGGDLTAIDQNNRRYNLMPFNIKAYDIQMMYKEYKGGKPKKMSLETCSNELVPKNELEGFRLHNPMWDAKVSMLVFKNIIKMEKENISHLLSVSKDYKINLMKESQHKREVMKEKLEHEKKLKVFRSYYDQNVFHSESLLFKGERFSFSNLLLKNIDAALKVEKALYKNGGVVVRFKERPSFVVALNKEDKDSLLKIDYFVSKEIDVVTIDDLVKKIGETSYL